MYEAICTGASECTVTLANGQIGTSGLVIQREQVLSWSQGGSGTKTDVGMGVATTVLFGLPVLIGFAAKKHDYTFSINYVDKAGNVQATTVGFKNNVPANQFMMEMIGANPVLLTLGIHLRRSALPYWSGFAEAKALGIFPRKGSKAVHVLRPQCMAGLGDLRRGSCLLSAGSRSHPAAGSLRLPLSCGLICHLGP